VIKPIEVVRYGKKFITNGCTGITFYVRDEEGEFVLLNGSPIINECARKACIVHDYHYTFKDLTRKQADKKLLEDWKKCMPESEAIAAYWGVRIFGLWGWFNG